jgi:hypothetical protein
MAAPKGNKFALGLTNNGRPPEYKNVEDMEVKCSEYFLECSENKEKATITGLALYLGFESRQSLYDYKEKKDFSYLLKRATLAVENSYETNGTAFDIFALKNMGWKDKTEVEQTNVNNEPVKIVFGKK